jgi:hypothetical protein
VAVPLRQNLRIGAYLARQKLARRGKFPLIVELEPLFACNLACMGCANGLPTAAAAIPGARTAWRTAATSRPRVLATMGSLKQSLRALTGA